MVSPSLFETESFTVQVNYLLHFVKYTSNLPFGAEIFSESRLRISPAAM